MKNKEFWPLWGPNEFKDNPELAAELKEIGEHIPFLRFEVKGKPVYLIFQDDQLPTIQTLENLVPEIVKGLEKIEYG